MTNCAIVTEYNPFHTGHKYQLDTVKSRGIDNIICVMSGNFVQSAEPAFCDKALRAECAVRGGADAVIELPALYATSSAQYFAEGALKIISKLKDIKYLAMGATADADKIYKLYDAKSKNIKTFLAALNDSLKSGKSYNAASANAYSAVCDAPCDDIFTDPNNILCLEYLATIDKYAPNTEPLIIKRIGADYGSLSTTEKYISATAIRHAVDDGNSNSICDYLPCLKDELISRHNAHRPNLEAYGIMSVYAIKSMPLEQIRELKDCSEGLEYLIKKCSDSSTYDELLNSSVCRRYGKKRIKRLLFDALTLQNKDLLSCGFITRLLACKNNFDFSILPSLVKTNNADIKSAAVQNPELRRVLAVDERASALYNSLCGISGDYYNYSLVKV